MQVYTLAFVYLCLPAMLLCCLAIPQRWRIWGIVGFSGLFYYWVEREQSLLLLTILLFDYLMAHLVVHSDLFLRLRRTAMICSVGKSIVLLTLYGVMHELYGTKIPLGLEVACLISMGYVIDCYHGYAYAQRNPAHLFLMAGFFPQLYAGPLVYYNKMLSQWKNMQMGLDTIGAGGRVFVCGLAKKVILGDTLMQLYLQLEEVFQQEHTTLAAWSLPPTLLMASCFLLSGFCDMAKGMGMMFGFTMPDNFNYPCRALSINDFFTRFNLTINKFVRKYVYLSLGGSQGCVVSVVFNILLSTILMGMWFGFQINILLWGCFLAVFVIFERYFLHRYEERIPTLVRWLYAISTVLISFVFLAGKTPAQSWELLGAMFGNAPDGGYSTDLLYLIYSNWLILLLSAFGVSGLLMDLSRFFQQHLPKTWEICSTIFCAGLLIVTTAFML